MPFLLRPLAMRINNMMRQVGLLLLGIVEVDSRRLRRMVFLGEITR